MKQQSLSEEFYTTSSEIVSDRPVNPSLAHALKVVMEAKVCSFSCHQICTFAGPFLNNTFGAFTSLFLLFLALPCQSVM